MIGLIGFIENDRNNRNNWLHYTTWKATGNKATVLL